MKKALLAFAIIGFVACNNEGTTDSSAPTDTAATPPVDTAAPPATDTTKKDTMTPAPVDTTKK